MKKSQIQIFKSSINNPKQKGIFTFMKCLLKKYLISTYLILESIHS